MIIGLGHTARVGKDSVADVLVNEWGFTRIGFADRLKAVALDTNPRIGHEHLRDLISYWGWDAAKDRFPDVRLFLQHLGVAMRHHIARDVWVKPVLDTIGPARSTNFVIPDVRFKNEALALSVLSKTHLVNVTRPGYGPESTHVSETELTGFPWDYTLENDGELGDLSRKVTDMLACLAVD